MKLGQTIVEILVAIGVATVALLAIVQMASRSVSNSGYAKRQAVATAYASEGMEWVKRQKGLVSWSEFYAKGTAGGAVYGLNTFPATWATLAGGCSGTIGTTEYTRCVRLTTATVSGKERLTVAVEVIWNEATGPDRAVQETVFSRY